MSRSAAAREIRIDEERFLADLEALGRIGRDPATGGVGRVAYGEADRQARAWIRERLAGLGLAVEVDPAGNTVALLAGEDPSLPPLATGSHSDTVPSGGRYDGALGVVAALAGVRALCEAGVRLRHPLAVIDFAAEEATMAGGTTGSQAMAGLLDPGLLARPAFDGRPVAEHVRAAGLDPERFLDARRPPGSFAAFVELHIEQGDRLEREGTPVGVVEAIVSIRRYRAVFEGAANHAGTTAMDRRRDARVAAAPFVTAVRDLALEGGIVATVGTVEVHPGAPNVIPGRVVLGVDARSLEPERLDGLAAALAEHARRRGGRLELVVDKPPVRCHPLVVSAAERVCRRRGLSFRRLASFAGHDAMNMARLAPAGMIFVPSEKGISHAPEERTSPEDCVRGAEVLLETLVELDGDACQA